MSDERSSYKSILRGMSVFGGVQVFQILINLVRGKFIAIFLGPAGSGIASLFTSASVSIQQLSSLGIPMALTREVAKDNGSQHDIESTVRAGRRAVMLTALLGMIICGGGAWWLSKGTFGTYDYSWQFVLLSIAVAFTLLWNGDQAILQGLRKVNLLSRATLISSITGLVAGVPLYWLLGTDGIVPAMVILAVTMWIFYRHALSKTVNTSAISRSIDYSIIKRMVVFGLILMSGQFIGSVVIYAANVYIRST
ncbi:MAG: oligosaccharide flippase family protein, partial [Muribaculum sp.]|nr:oligosaccharide flippase family protein [Muribaculum sp.]